MHSNFFSWIFFKSYLLHADSTFGGTTKKVVAHSRSIEIPNRKGMHGSLQRELVWC